MSPCRYCGHDGSEPTARWVFFLPLMPPSQNVVGGNQGVGARLAAYRRYRDQYTLLIKAALQRDKVPKATLPRVAILTRYYSGRQRPMDMGNLIGGCKSLVDAMIRACLIVDDSPEWVRIYYRQARAEDSKVSVEVEE